MQDINEKYDHYIREIEDTSNLIFSPEEGETEKLLNALQYMRIIANKESETIEGLDDISISGFNAAILGEGSEQSQNAYLRDLLNHEDIKAKLVSTFYKDEEGKKQEKQLVKIRTKEGKTLYVSAYDFNGSMENIEKYNTGSYEEKDLLDLFIHIKEETLPISYEDLKKGLQSVDDKLIQKYHIKEISQITGIDSTCSPNNQLKLIGLIGSNVTEFQGEQAELFRTVRMEDGKEIEVSKLLELFYKANNIKTEAYTTGEKDDVYYQFEYNGMPYTITPSKVFRNTKGEIIDTTAIFIAEDMEKAVRVFSNKEETATLEECENEMNSKIKNSLLQVRDFSFSSLQEKIQKTPKDIDLIRKEEEIKHYSLPNISFELDLPTLLKSGQQYDQLKAQCMLMGYLNQQSSYNKDKDGKQYQYVALSDNQLKYTPDMLELFYIQNGIEYRRDENNRLVFQLGDKECAWQYDYSSLYSQKGLAEDLLANQSLIDINTGNKITLPSFSEKESSRINDCTSLSTRLPVSKEEKEEMEERLTNLQENIHIPEEAKNRNQADIHFYFLDPKKGNQKSFEAYQATKEGKEYFFNTDEQKLLKEYQNKVETVATSIAKSSKTEEDKILTAMEYIRLNGRYENHLDYTMGDVGSRISQSALAYALTGEGVCASQAQYLTDILRQMGVDADIESCKLSMSENEKVIGNAPNHMIVRVMLNGNLIVLDPTNYTGQMKSLKENGNFSIADASGQSKDVYFYSKRTNQENEGKKTRSEIQEAFQLKQGLAAKLYPKEILEKGCVKTPFGEKTFKEMHFNTIETTDENILEAQKRASSIVVKELGIDKISEELDIADAQTDINKQAKIFGFIENHLQKPEGKEIRSRIVDIGNNHSLELNDILELLYFQNNIDYDIVGYQQLATRIDGDEVTIQANKAYNKGLTIEEERNSIFKKDDDQYLMVNSMIERVTKSLSQKGRPLKEQFDSEYKVEGVNEKEAIRKAEENAKQQKQNPDLEIDDDEAFIVPRQ